LTTLDNFLTLSLFDAINSTKKTNNDLQNSNIQTSNTFYPSSSNFVTLSPFFPMLFSFYFPVMFNQQNLQLFQPTYTSNNPSQISSISISSINEFFGNLKKEFGENIFDEVKNKFLQ